MPSTKRLGTDPLGLARMRLHNAQTRLADKNTRKRRVALEVAEKVTLRAIDRVKGRDPGGKK